MIPWREFPPSDQKTYVGELNRNTGWKTNKLLKRFIVIFFILKKKFE